MSKEFDKNRLKRLRAIDEILSTSDEGVTMSQIIGQIGEITGIKTDRFAVIRDLKFLKDQLGMDVIESHVYLTYQKNSQIRKSKAYKYKNSETSLFKINITDEEREFLSKAMEMIGLKGICNLKLFKRLKLNSDYKSSIISFTKNPLEKNIGVIFQNLLDTIKDKRVISIRIRDRKPPFNIVTHKVHPWYLREYNRRWYLFGMEDSSRTIMHYALDRIVMPIRNLKRDYIDPTSSIDDILKDIIGVSLPDNATQEILFWVSDESADFVSRKLIHHTQVEIQKVERILLSALPSEVSGGKFFKIFCKNNYELRREMLSFGAELIVLYPNNLRDQLKAILQKMSENYAQ